MDELKTIGLFIITALVEIIGCYLPYMWLHKSIWLLIPAAISLALLAWLLTLHPAAAGRVYAAYGGVYICVSIFWLWAVDGIKPTNWDLVGAGVALTGMVIIMFAPRGIRNFAMNLNCRTHPLILLSVFFGPRLCQNARINEL